MAACPAKQTLIGVAYCLEFVCKMDTETWTASDQLSIVLHGVFETIAYLYIVSVNTNEFRIKERINMKYPFCYGY